MTTSISFLDRKSKAKLAYFYSPATAEGHDLPLVLFLGGYRSDMEGTKALYLQEECQNKGQGFIRMDYSGHGASDGEFKDGTISVWKNDALDLIDHLDLKQDLLIVGSSMGGWIALLIALERQHKVKAVIGIAAAPDFTEDVWHNRMDENQRALMLTQGYIEQPNEYSDDPYIFTKNLIDDGKHNLLLNKQHNITFPICLLQGMKDEDVHWETTSRIEESFIGEDVDIVIIEDGDHRLSREQDLKLLKSEVIRLSHLDLNAKNSL